MATKEQIKKVILDLAGNPDTGVVRVNVDKWATAIVELDKTPRDDNEVQDGAPTPALKKESRVTKPEELR